MQATVTQGQSTDVDRSTVRELLDAVRVDGRTSLSAPEAKRVCDAYGIAVPQEGLATSSEQAVELGSGDRFPGGAQDRLA